MEREPIGESWSEAFHKIGGIAYNRKFPDKMRWRRRR